ncbi:hypothetical protein IFR04_005352 [Cadophora malorum]|uniref:Uncharacterized protein n=1 Tax=Cadophora malorum TaxID=108018 RepID=A0A8H7WB80_9HELO|nr:hypothetical protein IFR04_005352 [Cadophora malorum]
MEARLRLPIDTPMSGTNPGNVETNSDCLPTNAILEEKLADSQRKIATAADNKDRKFSKLKDIISELRSGRSGKK